MKLTITRKPESAPVAPKDGPYLIELSGETELAIPISVLDDDDWYVGIRENGRVYTDGLCNWTGIGGYPKFRRVRITEIIVEEI